MIKLIKKLLLELIDRIDKGNSNLSEEESLKALEILKEYTHKDNPFSKYSACEYLNISRATFDSLVRKGIIPKGKKIAGFKELQWTKKDLDKAMIK